MEVAKSMSKQVYRFSAQFFKNLMTYFDALKLWKNWNHVSCINKNGGEANNCPVKL